MREDGGFSQVVVPDAGGSGDFVRWLDGPAAWLVGNGLSNRTGPMQLVQTA